MKENKDLFNESCKPLKREIKEDIRRWKVVSFSLIGRYNTVKIFQKTIYLFITIPTKIPMTFHREIENATEKYIWKHNRPQIDKANLIRMSNHHGPITIQNFKL
jgi:hypothetical protein